MSDYCGRWAYLSPEGVIERFFCGHGSCHREVCRKRFYASRVALLADLIQEYNLIRFFTLTLDPQHVTGDPWEYISIPWQKFRHRMKRRYPGWKYVAVLERHKDRDFPHIHGFTDVWMKKEDWTSMWDSCGGGKITWVEKVDSPDLSEYVSKQLDVAKYVGKDQLVGSYHAGKKVRTLWRSTHTKSKKELTSETGWRILQENVYDADGQLTQYGRRWRQINGWKEKRQREDMEATRSTLSESSTQAGEQDVEAEESKNRHGESEKTP